MFSSCKKQEDIEKNNSQNNEDVLTTDLDSDIIGKDTVKYYTDVLLKSDAFSKFLDITGNNTLDVVSEVKSKCGVTIKPSFQSLAYTYSDYVQIDQFYLSHGIDTSVMIDKKAESLTSLVMLKASHPEIFRLSEQKRTQIIRNAIDSLRNSDYRNANASDESVIKFMSFYNRISNNGAAGRLSMDEVTECLKDALGGAVVGLAGLASTIYGAVSNSSFGWSTIRRVAKQALKSFWGGAVVGSVISFGWCILWDTID